MEKNTTASRLKAIIIFPVAVSMIILGGALAGLTTAAIGSLFYIALLFPLGMGFAGGNIVSAVTQLTRLRSARHLILVSFLTALVIYGTYHYGRYLALQVQMSLEIFSDLTTATDEDNLKVARAFVDYALEQETGRSGFAGYLLLRAKEGISIGRFYSQNRLHLGPALTWLYWALEFGIILWVAITVGRKSMRVPVCEACGRPYAKERHLGGTSPANESLLIDLIQRNDVDSLVRLIEPDAGLPSLEVYMQRCEACEKSASHLTVRRAFRGTSGSLQFSDVSKVTMQPVDSILFLKQLASAGD
ncbi:MAG TPA: hypothetical protein VJ821_09485 [Anaerolineales bacterium]|nr:hypothetical protein [Anaerolineales bacterium]